MGKQDQVTIESSAYGTMVVGHERIYSFESGLVGLPDYKRFAWVPLAETPFFVLHAVDGDLSFILSPPELAVDRYEFELPDDLAAALGAAKPDDVITLLIVNIVDGRFYVNMKAPVLLVPGTKKGCQFIIQDADLPVRYPLGREESDHACVEA